MLYSNLKACDRDLGPRFDDGDDVLPNLDAATSQREPQVPVHILQATQSDIARPNNIKGLLAHKTGGPGAEPTATGKHQHCVAGNRDTDFSAPAPHVLDLKSSNVNGQRIFGGGVASLGGL